MTAFRILLLCTAGALWMAADVRAADWPQWRGPDRDGKSAETGLSWDWDANPPELVYMVEGMGRGYASVAVVDGTLYTTGDVAGGQAVTAVDAAGGEQRWQQIITKQAPKHGYEGSRCTPSVDGDRVYVVTSNGQITCLNAKNGKQVWTRMYSEWGGRMMSGWGFSESPLVDGDWVLCTPGGPAAMVVALDKMSGKEVWKSAVPEFGDLGKPGAGYSSLVISEGAGVKQYVTTVGRGVIGVRARDGKFLWGYNKLANGTANIPTPIVSGDYVFASTGYGTGAALLELSKKGGGVQATEKYFLGANTFQNHHGGMILVGDKVYAGNAHKKGFPICIDLETGEVVWEKKTREFDHGSAAITYVDGQLIFRYEDGLIALIEATPEGFHLNGTFTPAYVERPSWSHPVVVNGLLHLREQDKLMCYKVQASGGRQSRR